MKRTMGLAAVMAAGGLAAAGCSGPGIQNRYANWADPCWPERYAYEDRQTTIQPFAAHVSNGNAVDHTLVNYHFEVGSDKLTPGGMQKLDYLSRRRPTPDRVMYLQTARDVAYDVSMPDKTVVARQDLDAKRVAAVQRYLASTTAGRAVAVEVQVIDPPDLTTSAQGQANAMRGWPNQYTASVNSQGTTGTVSGTGRNTGSGNTAGGAGTAGGSGTAPR